MSNCSWLWYSIALVLLAFPNYSAAACSGTFSLTESGAISGWTICSNGVPIQAVNPDQGRFNIVFSGERLAQPDVTQWRQLQTGGENTSSIQYIDSHQTVEILRTYQVVSDSNVRLSVSITNLSDRALSGIKLAIRLGGHAGEFDWGDRTLADYVYQFERVEATSADGNWGFPLEGMRANKVAITSRHASIFVDSKESMMLDSSLDPDAAQASAFEPGDWLLIVAAGQLDPGDDKTSHLQLSALPAQSDVLKQVGFPNLVYADVWGPLGALCRLVESALRSLSNVVGNLGLAVILLAVLIRLITLPASIWAIRQQEEYRLRFGEAKPKIDKARKDFKGAEQSERILAIYKEHRITPFSGLKGSLGLLIQIPFLLAVFNVTTRSSIFAHEQFMWIRNLALPDAIMALPISLPVLGGYINLLPLLLGVFNIMSALRDQNAGQSSRTVPVLISLLIVAAFYSFSAALVLYWLSVNLIQTGERIVITRLKA